MAISIFTGTFSLYHSNPMAVSIAGNEPDDFQGRVYRKLVPPAWLYERFKHDGDTIAYTTLYTAYVLNKLTQRDVMRDVGGCVLLYNEAPWQFSHRLIVAAWLMDDPNVIVREMTKCPLLVNGAP
jgi:hypothetical protein